MSRIRFVIHSVKGVLFRLVFRTLIAQYLNVVDELLTLLNDFVFGVALQILADVFPYAFQELYLFEVGVVLFADILLFLIKLLLQSLQYRHKIVLNECFLLLHLQVKPLHLQLYLIPVLPVFFDFAVESCELVQNFCFMELVYFVKVGDIVTFVLNQEGITSILNMPQSEQMGT